MNVWRKLKDFIGLLEHKQYLLRSHIEKIKAELTQLKSFIISYRYELVELDYRINHLIPETLLSREEIYKSIRQQGVLLTKREVIRQKIAELEELIIGLEENIEYQRCKIVDIDKKHYKTMMYLNRFRNEALTRRENFIECEIQEIASYGRKDFANR